MEDRSNLLTEKMLPESSQLDMMATEDAVALMNAEDLRAVAQVRAERAPIARAVEMVADALAKGGRLIYVGAGTSGRLGVLDASECPPTFGTDPDLVQCIMAGGPDAVFRSKEGAEDDPVAGGMAIADKQVGPNDIVMGIAAGGTTPFVHGALSAAAERGAKTIFLTCVARLPGEPAVDLVIRPLTGPEVLTGSTRLKAGTATKLVLNTITTLAMVRLGKVHGNLMVDLRATNRKLWDRAARIVATLTGLDRSAAIELLKQADGHVKTAVVMHARKLDAAEAQRALQECNGNLRQAMHGV
jgi:N-acetylmuramic acid 6-phosphate etherase